MPGPGAHVQFEQQGSELKAIQVVREARSPIIVSIQRALFTLGIVVSSYHARPSATRLVERLVIERTDGGSIDGALTAKTKAAILPIVLESHR